MNVTKEQKDSSVDEKMWAEMHTRINEREHETTNVISFFFAPFYTIMKEMGETRHTWVVLKMPNFIFKEGRSIFLWKGEKI